MPLPIQRTVIATNAVEIVISDSADIEAAKLAIQVRALLPVNRDLPPAVLQGIILRDARDEISEQIQAMTQKHGPVP